MRLTVGFKIGGGFFLLTLMLIIAGIVGYSGALTLGQSIDNIGSKALQASNGSSDFSIAVQKQTAITQALVEAANLPKNSDIDAIKKAQLNTSSALDDMNESGLVNESEISKVETAYKNYLQSQKDLMEAHRQYVEARSDAFKGFNDFEDYMKTLEFFTNQIYNLPNVDQGDKIELTAEFYQSKVALQLRFYYVQRYLGGSEEMLDLLESAEDDLTDETDELMELDLVDNTIRTGRYENRNYIEVLEELVEQHTTQFETVVSKFKKFKEVKAAYALAESDVLLSTSSIVESIDLLVTSETEDANRTSSNVNHAILVAIGIGVVVAIFATLFSIYRVVRPITVLAESAAQIAEGDLDKKITSKSEDEVGDLANNFDSMRVQIRKKLRDLEHLNTAGESIAGAMSQYEALQTSLETMFDKTKVEFASVYLLDNDDCLKLEACFPVLRDRELDTAVTFERGMGVAGKSVRDKEIIFVEDSSQSELYSKQTRDETPKALLCVPLMDGDDALGVMNFSGNVGQVYFEESDYEFAASIARSVTITIKNIRMREVIKEQNRTLEQKVEQRTKDLQVKTNDIMSMMQNMHQGLFTIIEGGLIHPEYAVYLEQIFETEDIADRDFLDLLFSQSDLGSDNLHQIKTGIDAIIGEDEMMWGFNEHLLVDEYEIQVNGNTKILAVEWDPILLDDEVEKVMVTVRDVTKLKVLEQEAQEKKQELDIIGQILSVDMDKFTDFVASSQQFISDNKRLIEKQNDKDTDAIALLFRNMHTIKGNARTYGFTYITDEVHLAENTYDELRKNEEKQWDSSLLLEELELVQEKLDTYIDICENVLGRNVRNIEDRIYTIKGSDLDRISHALTELHEGKRPEKADVEKMLHIVHNLNAITFEKSIEDTCRSLESIARQLGKPAPEIIFSGGDLLLKKDATGLLNNVFSHLLRNSMDHGIESAEERLEKGKTEEGHIYLSASMQGELMKIEINDDGKGLDINMLKQKGKESGLVGEGDKLTNENVAALIFKSGMSTKQTVSSISGRGVGMDAVKKFIEDNGGSVSIILNENSSNDSHFQQFKTVLELPVAAV